MQFMLDHRQHGTQSLLQRNLAPMQGPALCVGIPDVVLNKEEREWAAAERVRREKEKRAANAAAARAKAQARADAARKQAAANELRQEAEAAEAAAAAIRARAAAAEAEASAASAGGSMVDQLGARVPTHGRSTRNATAVDEIARVLKHGRDDLWGVLGIRRKDRGAEVTKAFKKVAAAVHPDKNPHERKEEATEAMEIVNDAKTVLGDDAKHRLYASVDGAWGRYMRVLPRAGV